jgi:hypothetical protein
MTVKPPEATSLDWKISIPVYGLLMRNRGYRYIGFETWKNSIGHIKGILRKQ